VSQGQGRGPEKPGPPAASGDYTKAGRVGATPAPRAIAYGFGVTFSVTFFSPRRTTISTSTPAFCAAIAAM